MRVSPLVTATCVLSLAACWASAPEERVDVAAERAAVAMLDSSLNAAIQRKDLPTVVSAYAPDAALLWQNDPRLTGPQIRDAWSQAFALAGFGLRLHSRVITIARAGDLALDEGALELDLPGPKGITTTPGKYLVVARKADGRWQILYDVYNTDPPPAAK